MFQMHQRTLRGWNSFFGVFMCFWGTGLLVVAGDWSEFRGGSSQGVGDQSKPYPISWNAEENVEWKTEVPGMGWSSPSLSQGKIVLTTAVVDGEGYELRALCLGEKSGDILWDKMVFEQGSGAPNIHRKNSHASPTPIISGELVFVHFGHLGTACLSLSDGEIVWENQDIKYSPVHGNGGSPVLVNGKLIFSCDGASNPFVVALDASNGKEVWRVPRSVDAKRKFSFCTGRVLEIGGRKQVVLPGSDMVGSYDPDTGEEIWRVSYDGYSVVPQPVFGEGLIFISTGYDRASLLAINPKGEGDLGKKAIVWQTKRSVAKTPSYIFHEGLLYNLSDNGILSCFEAKTGEVIYDERLGGNYSSSLLLLGGKLYCTSEEGVTSVIVPGREFKRVAQNDIEERTLASLSPGYNRILYRSESHLYSIKD